MKNQKMKSNCCQASMKVISADEGTSHYECEECGEACDPEMKNQIVENPTKERHGFEVTKMSLLNLQVCSKFGDDKVERLVQQFYPSGTSNNWHLEREGNLAPVDCDKKDGSKHYVFSC